MLQGEIVRTDETITAEGLKASSAKLLPAGTLLLSIFATIGRTAVLRIEAATNQAIAGLRIKDESHVHPPYLRRYLEFASAGLASQGRGVAQANINLSILRAHEVPLPTIEEQRRIGAVLDAADALRTKRRQALAKLDTLTQAIFIGMFGDPLTNPRGLPTVCLETVAGQITDGEHATPPRSTSGVKLLSARNVRNGGLDLGDVDFVEHATYERLRRRCDPGEGDLLISCSGTIGRVARLDGAEPFSLVRSVAMVRPLRDRVDPVYLEAHLRTDALNRMMKQRANASSQANLFQNQIRKLPVMVPGLDEQATFSRAVVGCEAHKRSQLRAADKTDALFTALQHRAFRGEL